MKTVNCIPNRGPDRDRGLPKVVDLAAWKAEHLAGPDVLTRAPERNRDRKPVRRPTAPDWAELAATLAVAVAFFALAARVLL